MSPPASVVPTSAAPSNITGPPGSCRFDPVYGCLSQFWCDPSFGLSDAGYQYCFIDRVEGELLVVSDSQAAWLISHGDKSTKTAARVCQWIAFVLAVLLLCYYGWSAWKSTCGWEEVYVCLVEVGFVTLEIFKEFDSPVTVYLSTGNLCYFARYCLKDDYSSRAMALIVSCIGMIVFGLAAGLAVGWLKWFLYFLGCAYSYHTYFQAAKCYIEANQTLPKGTCRTIVKIMAGVFFTAWGTYPILWLLGPEGLMLISGYASTICHTFCDILAKELWTFLGHLLRIKVHEHILIYGDIRKRTVIQVAGESMEVEEFCDPDDEDAVKKPMADLAHRQSFIIMRDRMRARGIDLHDSVDELGTTAEPGAPKLQPGCIILVVNDLMLADLFTEPFANLAAKIELVPALGSQAALQLAQQARNMGGCDCVLVHPDFLKDTSPKGLVSQLRMMGQRICSFGRSSTWESVNVGVLDGWFDGPPFNKDQITRVLLQIQELKQQQQMQQQFNPRGMMTGPSLGANSTLQLLPSQYGNSMYPGSSMSPAGGYGIDAQGTNPLYVSEQSLIKAGRPMPASLPDVPPASSPNPKDAREMEVIQQLMEEISALKGELAKQ